MSDPSDTLVSIQIANRIDPGGTISKIPQAHDRFFKLLLEQPVIAKALLHERLSPAIVRQLADVDPEPLATEFVGERLHGVLSDKLFRLPVRDVPNASHVCIVEHQSTLVGDIEFHLLKDYNATWQHLVQQGLAECSAVTCLLVFHGLWRRPRTFPQGLSRVPGLATRGVNLSFHLFELGRGDERRLSTNPWLRGGLKLLRHGSRPTNRQETRRQLISAFTDLRDAPEQVLGGAAHYVLSKWRLVSRADLEEVVSRVLSKKERRVVSKAAKEYMAEGEQRGERRGEANLFLHLLEQKFGQIPPELRTRIEGAKPSQVKDWSVRLITEARSFDEIFENA